MIYNGYLQATHAQAWKNVAMAAGAAATGCASDRKACAKGDLIPTIAGAAAADLSMWVMNWNMDQLNADTKASLILAGCGAGW